MARLCGDSSVAPRRSAQPFTPPGAAGKGQAGGSARAVSCTREGTWLDNDS